jgi:hypothetical protein
VKNTRLLFLIFFCLNVLVGCDSHSTEKIPEQNEIEENEVTQKDSIVEYYAAQIQKYYTELQQGQSEIELELIGERTFENDPILIMSFREIIKFGSWRYCNSSLFFHKKGNQLLPVKPSLIPHNEDIDLSEEISYPNRIPGKFDTIIDLTGDGIPEYTFRRHFACRDVVYEEIRIFKMDTDKNILRQLNLKTQSSGFLYAIDTLEGDNEKLEIIKSNQKELLVQINHITTKRNSSGTIDVIADKLTYYKYNTKAQKFIEIKSK